MSPAESESRGFTRILLALDSSVPNTAALEEAARLARRLGAQLNALFVEDASLLDLAQSPVARHYNVLSRTLETVDLSLMEARLLAQARDRRRAVEIVASRAGVPWSFRTVRGRVADVVIAAAADQDLLLVGWATRHTDRDSFASIRAGRPRGQHQSTVRAIAVGAGRPVLLLREGNILGRPVAVVFDGSPGAARALITAATLAGIARTLLVVLIAGDQSLAARGAAILRDTPARDIEIRRLDELSVDAVCRARAATACGVVVLDAESPMLAGDDGSPLAAFPCPVLLTR